MKNVGSQFMALARRPKTTSFQEMHDNWNSAQRAATMNHNWGSGAAVPKSLQGANPFIDRNSKWGDPLPDKGPKGKVSMRDRLRGKKSDYTSREATYGPQGNYDPSDW